jgi:hypothetical protein
MIETPQGVLSSFLIQDDTYSEPTRYVHFSITSQPKRMKVVSVEPQSMTAIKVTAINDDARVYSFDTEFPPSES